MFDDQKQICSCCGQELIINRIIINNNTEGIGRFGYEIYCKTDNCEYRYWQRPLTQEEYNEL